MLNRSWALTCGDCPPRSVRARWSPQTRHQQVCGVDCGQPHEAGSKKIPEQGAGIDDCRTRTTLDIVFEWAGRTAFVSAPAQFIVPTPAEPPQRTTRIADAPRVFVVSLPPKEVTLPSHHRRPHAACQGQCGIVRRCHNCKSPDRAGNCVAFRPSALSLPLNRVITPETDGTRLPCRDTNNRHGKAGFCFRPSSESPHMLPHVFYSGHSPSLRLTPPAIADRYLMTNQVAGSASFRTPQ